LCAPLQLGLPLLLVEDHQFFQDEFEDAVQQGRLVGDVPVERYGLAAQLRPSRLGQNPLTQW